MRFYHAGIGKFIAKDILQYGNRYRAFGNSPPKQVDPLGMQDVDSGQKDTQAADAAQQAMVAATELATAGLGMGAEVGAKIAATITENAAGIGTQPGAPASQQPSWEPKPGWIKTPSGKYVPTGYVPPLPKKPYAPVAPKPKAGILNGLVNEKTGQVEKAPWTVPGMAPGKMATWADLARQFVKIRIMVKKKEGTTSIAQGACVIGVSVEFPLYEKHFKENALNGVSGVWELLYNGSPVTVQRAGGLGGSNEQGKRLGTVWKTKPTGMDVAFGGAGEKKVGPDGGTASIDGRTGTWQARLTVGTCVKMSNTITITP